MKTPLNITARLFGSARIFLLLVAAGGLRTAIAQDTAAISAAFTESYKLEYAKDYPRAIAAMTKVYAEKSYEVNLRLGWLYYSAKDYPKSQGYYQKAVALMPYSIEARLGYIYPTGALGNWEDVARTYKDILKIDPQNSTASYYLGLIHYNKKEYADAVKYLEPAVNKFPFSYNEVHLLAWAYLGLGKMNEAKLLFQRALMIQPGDESALEGLKSVK